MSQNLQAACRSVLALGILVASAIPAGYADVNEDILWQVYNGSCQDKRAVLEECFNRLHLLEAKSTAASGAVNWDGDEDFQWLLQQRIPTILAVERELQGQPKGPYLGGLLRIMSAMGTRRLSRQLPDLLARTSSVGDQQQILKGMSELRDRDCVAALEEFLREAGPGTPEVLVVEAAEGLSLTRRQEYLPLLRNVSSIVKSAEESLRMSGARYRCGEFEMVEPILSVLKDDKEEVELQLWAVGFVAENKVSDAAPMLAHLVLAGPKELSTEALCALIDTSGYGEPPPADTAKQETARPQEEISEEGPPAEESAAPSPGPEQLNDPERAELVETIMKWWQEHPQARPQPLRPASGAQGLSLVDKGGAH